MAVLFLLLGIFLLGFLYNPVTGPRSEPGTFTVSVPVNPITYPFLWSFNNTGIGHDQEGVLQPLPGVAIVARRAAVQEEPLLANDTDMAWTWVSQLPSTADRNGVRVLPYTVHSPVSTPILYVQDGGNIAHPSTLERSRIAAQGRMSTLITLFVLQTVYDVNASRLDIINVPEERGLSLLSNGSVAAALSRTPGPVPRDVEPLLRPAAIIRNETTGFPVGTFVVDADTVVERAQRVVNHIDAAMTDGLKHVPAVQHDAGRLLGKEAFILDELQGVNDGDIIARMEERDVQLLQHLLDFGYRAGMFHRRVNVTAIIVSPADNGQ